MNVNYAKFPKSLIVEQFQGNYLKRKPGLLGRYPSRGIKCYLRFSCSRYGQSFKRFHNSLKANDSLFNKTLAELIVDEKFGLY